jgi:hypothetical protein
MCTDDRSLSDKIADAARATAEIKRRLEQLTSEAFAQDQPTTEVAPLVAAACPATMPALGRSGRAARNEVGRFRP